ncbi:MAG: hypothetical protein QOC82_2486, partial [Frankiaceae bacterium]|nr:hypothetical protein [Frankiaceae bacterium]
MIPDSFRVYAPSPRQMLWGIVGGFVLFVGLVAIVYATTTIPNPNDTATNQQTFYLFSNGKIMAHGGQVNRITVKLDQVPQAVRHAVLSAEDRGFESEPGISPTGILRACLDAVRTSSEVDRVEVVAQNLVFRLLLRQLDRDDDFFKFSRERPLLGQVGVLHVLLGDRRPALLAAAAEQVVQRGPRDAGERDAGVGHER